MILLSGVISLAFASPPITADVRSEYLQGVTITIPIRVDNPSAEATDFPDLSQRPHLVHFELQPPTK